jgi:hypothetical protein
MGGTEQCFHCCERSFDRSSRIRASGLRSLRIHGIVERSLQPEPFTLWNTDSERKRCTAGH